MKRARTTRFARWLKFNLVGLVGSLVQFTTLALLHRMAPGHYLLATAVAVEAAIVHNFVAHVTYTWRDRRATHALVSTLWRFQLSNGAVSLAGNLVLMRLLVSGAHLRVLVANGVAIVLCGFVNFWLGDAWAFAAHTRSSRVPRLRPVYWPCVALGLMALRMGLVAAQERA